MAKKKRTKKNELRPRFYEGYDIEWLRELGEEHPDFNLVAEYDAKYPKPEPKEEGGDE